APVRERPRTKTERARQVAAGTWRAMKEAPPAWRPGLARTAGRQARRRRSTAAAAAPLHRTEAAAVVADSRHRRRTASPERHTRLPVAPRRIGLAAVAGLHIAPAGRRT